MRWFHPAYPHPIGYVYAAAKETLRKKGLLDPDKNLEQQKDIAQRMVEGKMATPEDFETDSIRLAELVLALDEWMSKGGFPPKAWKKPGT